MISNAGISGMHYSCFIVHSITVGSFVMLHISVTILTEFQMNVISVKSEEVCSATP